MNSIEASMDEITRKPITKVIELIGAQATSAYPYVGCRLCDGRT